MNDELKLIKMISGEEMIGKVVSEDETGITFSAARVIVLSPIPGGQEMGIRLMPWFIGNPDGENTVERSGILGNAVTVPEDLDKYYRQDVTPIALA